MTSEQAERAVTTSAVIVGGIYAYRRLIEGGQQAAPHIGNKNAAKQLAGRGAVPPLAHFIVGYGFAFLVISAIAQVSPDTGGSFAVLVVLGTVLAQGGQLAADINGQLGASAPTAPAGHVAVPGVSSLSAVPPFTAAGPSSAGREG